jgi:hypothetical protein
MDERESHALAILEQKPEFYEESYRIFGTALIRLTRWNDARGCFSKTRRDITPLATNWLLLYMRTAFGC